MGTTAVISILVLILMPVVTQVGIDPVQFDVFMVHNLIIGLLTPPVGMALFVLSRVGKPRPTERWWQCYRSSLHCGLFWCRVSTIPQPTLWLPTLWYR